MRAVGVVAPGAVISFLVAICVLAGEAFLGLVAQPGPHQGFEIVAVMIGMAIVAVGSAIIFSIVVVVSGRRKAITRTAIGLIVSLALVLAAPAILGLVMTDPTDIDGEDTLRKLVAFLIVIAIPGLSVILAQWWTIQRYLVRSYHT